jgi:GT2 family glycosyltransferase
MCRVPGHLSKVGIPDLTAAAGPVLAVDREKFLQLGGYDELYFPGRIEDIDLGFRGWMAGWPGRYVPESLAYHRGFGSFGPEFGAMECERIAARNSLLFAWKNLRGVRLTSHIAWLGVRLARAIVTRRTTFTSAAFDAFSKLGEALRARRIAPAGPSWVARQEAYFDQFRW